MSIDDVTPEEWNKLRKNTTATGKLFHPQDQHADPVTKPDHYNKGGIEAIDYIKQQLGAEFKFYCAGNVMKYIHRYRYKNGVEDLKKAEVYLDWLIKEIEGG
tara:strand:+ start:2820 stop:3125 length:306 start_codon:yes stop_codon:yes gene_type:complete